MYRASWVGCLVMVLFAGILQAQSSRLSIRAASDTPVDGWQRMDLAHSNRVVWVAPTEAVTANDIETAQPEVRPQTGDLVISVVFTNNGVNKMHALTAAQLKKHVALVVDDKVIRFPIVMSVQYEGTTIREGVLTGNTPTGLTQEEVDLIMSILRN
jgi:preprotein translocase subunit SecD